jgi:hypothetical protein
MQRLLLHTMFLVCAALLSPRVAAEDCTGEVLFEEPFETLEASWGPASETISAGDGKATLTPGINNTYWAWNTAFSLPEGELCAEVTQASDTADPKLSAAGLMFWIKDNANFYVLLIDPSGEYRVARYLDGAWAQNPLPSTPSSDLRTGNGETNSLAVRFAASTVTIFINGSEQTSLQMQAPGGASYVGIYAQSAKESADTWEFSKLRVSDLK